MELNNIQQEVLVLIQTSFAQRTLIGHYGLDRKYSATEELEQGFWNGLLNQMLPELMLPMQGRRSEQFIWQISFSEVLLLIDMAEIPVIGEDSYSINPRCFLSMTKMN